MIYKSIPDRKVIYKYWNESPLKGFLNIQAFDGENNSCMACGDKGNIDRAHIVAKCNEGSFQPSNIHALCQICHKLSERLESYDYWLWISLKSKLFSYGTDMTIEMDCTSSEDETLRPYTYEAAYPTKLVHYSLEYTELSLLERWNSRKEVSFLYLKFTEYKRFMIDLPALELVDTVLEKNKFSWCISNGIQNAIDGVEVVI